MATPVTVHKIHAIREENYNRMECYANDISTQVALSLNRVIAENPTITQPTKDQKMHNEYLEDTSTPIKKTAMPGIGAGSAARHIATLQRLGLVPAELAEPLTQLAAANAQGRGEPVGKFHTVSVYELDRALRSVDCSLEQRMAFKLSLRQCGLIVN
jgi:hypothetical protein